MASSHLQPIPCLPAAVFHYTRRPLAIVGLNTDIIWSPTSSNDPVGPRSDGWWGPHEYAVLPQPYDKTSPYLAWIPSLAAYDDPRFEAFTGLDPSILRLSFQDFPLVTTSASSTVSPSSPQGRANVPHLPPKPQAIDTGRVELSFVNTSDAMRAIVKQQVLSLTSTVKRAIDAVSNNSQLASIRMPEQAIFRLQQSYYWNLLPGTVTAAGHHLILSSMKRSVLELHGFLLWLSDSGVLDRDVLSHESSSLWPFRTRGVIVNDASDYRTIGRAGVSVYMEADLSAVELPSSARQIELSPIPLHRQLLTPHGSRKGHHTYIYFYPPIVENPGIYELAARGYASRLDEYQPNAEIDRLHTQMHKDISGS
jgi:hypothetical protein